MAAQESTSTLAAFDTEARFKYTESPNPSFVFGQKPDVTAEQRAWAEGEKAGWTVVDTATTDPKTLYGLIISGLIISGLVPRPIAFVSSISEDGVENLAPFSWFNQVCAYPPIISVSFSYGGPKGLKDTPANINATKQFVVNLISEPFIENANATSIDAPAGVSEWELSGLTKAPSTLVRPPRVRESAFSMECELFQAIDIPMPGKDLIAGTLVLGHVKRIHIRNDVKNARGFVDPEKIKAVSRMGDITYGRIGHGFRLPRPVWEQEREHIEELLKGEASAQ